jgi:hypothetical protein
MGAQTERQARQPETMSHLKKNKDIIAALNDEASVEMIVYKKVADELIPCPAYQYHHLYDRTRSKQKTVDFCFIVPRALYVITFELHQPPPENALYRVVMQTNFSKKDKKNSHGYLTRKQYFDCAVVRNVNGHTTVTIEVPMRDNSKDTFWKAKGLGSITLFCQHDGKYEVINRQSICISSQQNASRYK